MKLLTLWVLSMGIYMIGTPLLAQVSPASDSTLQLKEVNPILLSIDTQKVANRYFTIGLSANAFKGSLQNSYRTFTPALHLGLLLNRKRRLNGSFNIAIGSYTADNGLNESQTISGKTPNNFVQSTFFALNYGLHIHVIKTTRFQWFLGTGVGLFRFNPKDEQGNGLISQKNTRKSTESYSNVTTTFPIYSGVNWFHKSGYGIGFQAGWWNTTSPYLDNVNELSTEKRNDNLLSYRFTLLVPFSTEN